MTGIIYDYRELLQKKEYKLNKKTCILSKLNQWESNQKRKSFEKSYIADYKKLINTQ